MGKFDIALKDLLSGAENELIKIAGFEGFKINRVENVEFQQVRERRADKILLGNYKNQKLALDIEFQITITKEFIIRLLYYRLDMKRKFPDYITGQLVFTFGLKEKVIDELIFEEKSDFGEIKFSCKIIDLTKIHHYEYLKSDNPKINALAIINPNVNIKEVIEKIKNYNLEKHEFLKILTEIHILSYLVGKEKEVEREVQKYMTGGEIDLMQINLFRKIFEKIRKEIEEKAKKKELEKGIKAGLKKGKKEGLREGLKEAIKTGLIAKFGKNAKRIFKKIEEIEDLKKLKLLKGDVLRAKTLKDFENKLTHLNNKKSK